MIRRTPPVLLAVLLVATSSAARAQAKPTFFLGAGPTFPIADYGTYAKTGWMSSAGVNFPIVSKGLWVGPEIVYGSNSHSDLPGDKTNLLGVDASVGVAVGNFDKVQPYFLGTLGYLSHQDVPASGANESTGAFLWGLGAGAAVPIGKVRLFTEARYMSTSATRYIPVFIGLGFGGR
jgi:hypothetical protein